MAIRKKAKGKTKAKGKKGPARKPASSRKTATVRKKPAKKPPTRRASPKKAPARTAAIRPPAHPVAAKPRPSPSAQPALPEDHIGVVTHYYSHLSVAILRLDSGTLRVGDVVHIRGHTTDFTQTVESLEVNHAPVAEVGPTDNFGLKVVAHVREHDVVYKVRR